MTIFIFLGVLLLCIVINMPIAYAILLSSVALMLHIDIFDAQIVAQNLISGADSFPLMAVPFFMLAGEIMNAGGLATRIVNVAMALVGHVRGGIGYVAIMTSVILASLSGSAIADAAALGALLVPMMVRAGYDTARSGGLVAAGGIIAPIIPPSIGFIIFGVAANVSISKLFFAGIVPGALMGIGLCVAWWLVTRGNKQIETVQRKSGKEILRALREGIWALMLPLIIIFGLRFGIFTPTEAGVVVAVYALFVSVFIYRELKFKQIFQLLVNAGIISGIVLFLVAAALVGSWMITVSQITVELTDLMVPLADSKTLLLFCMVLVVLCVGTVLDMAPIIMILTPVLMPIVRLAGIDEVYFGVIFMIACSIGLLTPPVGSVLNVMCGVINIKMDQIVRGVWPFLLTHIIILLILILFPALTIVPYKWIAG